MTKVTKQVRPTTKTEQNVLDTFLTTSAKIKYLTSLKWPTADIARKLGTSYQHVNNEQGRTAKNPREAQPTSKK
jgi:hypothetical protein